MRIGDKATYYRLFEAGRFGNKTKVWNSAEDALLHASSADRFAIRHRSSLAFRTLYNLDKPALQRDAIDFPKVPAVQQNISTMATDQKILWQGELMRDEFGLYGFVSFDKAPMKVALLNAVHWRGLRVKALIDTTLWPASRSDLEELEEDFPGHVIELSVYTAAVGDCPHRNTIIWEVRGY